MFYAVATLIESKIWNNILVQNENTQRILQRYSSENDPIHFSWLVCQGIDKGQIKEVLEDIAKKIKPFSVQSGGIGIFPGDKPVVTFQLVRNLMVSDIQREIWEKCVPYMDHVNRFYSPDFWIPHITLIHQNIGREVFCQFIENSIFTDVRFSFDVTNLSIIFQDGKKKGILYRFDFLEEPDQI